jgi:cell wall-associated NlpC family hydrolase
VLASHRVRRARCPLPASATAVVVTVTVTDATGDGFVAVFPSGQPLPTVSSVNYVTGQTIANLATVPVGANGAIEVYVSVATHVVVDVTGAYEPSGASAAGRFVPLGPTRAYDSRGQGGVMTRGTTRIVDLAVAGVPADAAGVALNVTVTASVGAGYWTVWGAGAAQPGTSSLNIEHGGQTIAAQVIVAVSDPSIAVFAQTGGHLVVDVAGYMTGASATKSTDGLFVPVTPTRLVDTRITAPSLGDADALELPVDDVAGPLAGRVAAMVGTVTVTETDAPGYVTGFAAGNEVPLASNLNVERADQTLANHMLVPVGQRGIGVYAQSATQLVVDVTGFVLGPPRPSPKPSPATARIEAVVAFARQLVGQPYQLGGAGPDVFDCSGLAAWVFNHNGVRHSRLLAGGYATDPRWRHVPISEARRGDLVFWRELHDGYVGHMGIYLGDGQVLQAAAPPWHVTVLPYYHWETTTWSGLVGVMYEEALPYAVRMIEGVAQVPVGLTDDATKVEPMGRDGWVPPRADNQPTVPPGVWTTRTMRLGDVGDDVRWAEVALMARGRSPGTVDTLFDANTESAVRAYQAAMGIPVSGVIDATTRGSLGISPGPDGG